MMSNWSKYEYSMVPNINCKTSCWFRKICQNQRAFFNFFSFCKLLLINGFNFIIFPFLFSLKSKGIKVLTKIGITGPDIQQTIRREYNRNWRKRNWEKLQWNKMKSFKKLFTSKSKTHSPASSFKIGGMGSLKVLDVIPSPEDDSEKLKKAFQGLLSISTSFFSFNSCLLR